MYIVLIMTIRVIRDKFGNKIKLIPDRLNHILTIHPEIKGLEDKIDLTLKDPDIVKQSIYDCNVHIYYKYFKKKPKEKHFAVVIKINDNNFIITTYITDRIKKGDLIWKKD